MTFGIIGNTKKLKLKEIVNELLTYIQLKKMDFVLYEEFAHWYNLSSGDTRVTETSICSKLDFPKRSDIIISLGGDGTMLMTARIIGGAGTPILGVNLGKLGFLAEVSVSEMQQCLDDIIKGNYELDERTVLQVENKERVSVLHGLNEIVIDKGASPRMVNLEVFVDDEYLVTYSADGIILSTQTGSTAYSLATGGPIVVPKSHVIIVNPIAPHTLAARPVVLPDDSTIRVIATTDSKFIHLAVDGQQEEFYDQPANFIINKAPYRIKLVKLKSMTYFELLRTKLMWGKDLRVDRKNSNA